MTSIYQGRGVKTSSDKAGPGSTSDGQGFRGRAELMPDSPGGQTEVLAFLGSEQAHGLLPDMHIETHISHVFLVGTRAYKMKKAIKLQFLDYRDLEARRKACAREIEINQRSAPQIYVDVVPITRTASGFQFGGDGEVAEYLVRMNRFDQGTLFNTLCARGDLKDPLISDLGEQIARLHLSAEKRLDGGGAVSVERTLAGVVRTLQTFEDDIFDHGSVTTWFLKMEAELLRQTRRLDLRGRTGFVRPCHGDLHLGNICLINGRPTPFDAIEFGDAYSVIDVLYDLAFPVMDLVACQASREANLLLNRYLEMTGDYAGLHVMPLFMSLRAGVRAMVHALDGVGAGDVVGRPGERTDKEKARAYFALAHACLGPCERKLVAVGGISGSGKSTLARGLAILRFQRQGAIILRSDAIRKRLFHQTAMVPLPSQAYSDGANTRVFRSLCRDAHRALLAGCSVIVDATFMNEDHRRQVEDVAAQNGVPFSGLWLDVEKQTALARVAARLSDVSDADETVIAGQLEVGAGDVAWPRIEAQGNSDQVLESAAEILKAPPGF